MIAFYHDDLDGYCSAALIKLQHPECRLQCMNYGDPLPVDAYEDGERVYLLDFSFQPYEEMHKLERADLIWIDHHKSAILWAIQEEFDVGGGILDDSKAACELTWEYLEDIGAVSSEVPDWVRLLGRYDVWDHSDPDVLPFQYGMRTIGADPSENMAIWHILLDGRIDKRHVVARGEIILDYVARERAEYIAAAAFPLRWEGLDFIAANRLKASSKLFASVEDDYDAMLTFGRLGSGEWTVSIYTDEDDIDLSEIAEKYGGGGHPGAAGFQCSKLPFNLGG